MTSPILVVAAAGNVGSAVVTALLERGMSVRAADLDVEHLRDRFPMAQAVHLDLDRPETFPAAVRGVRRMFLLRPPPVARVGPTLNALVDVGVAAGVEHVVFSSVAGADRNRIVPHHRVERHLTRSGVGHTILRPGFFAQNLGGPYRADIRDDDRLFVPAGRGRVAFIDVRDLGDLAAEVLASPQDHVGKGYELTGPEAVTFDQVADMLSAALDRPIRYEPATVAGYARHLHRHGLPVVQMLVQTVLHVGLRRGDAARVDPTLPQLLGRPARSIHDYIVDHADLWRHEPARQD